MVNSNCSQTVPLLDNGSRHSSSSHEHIAVIDDGSQDEIQSSEESLLLVNGSVDIFGKPSVRSRTGGWKACPFILGNEFCERMAYYGINTNLVVYLTKVLKEGNADAARHVANWSGTCYITTFIGAFLADAYLGRYWTIASLSSVYFIGMVLLTLSVSLPALKPQSCTIAACDDPSSFQISFFYIALYLIALGTGGIKPCVSSFGADQFDTEDPNERTYMTSFFNWFYFTINVGALIASTVLVYIQENIGWGLGFGIPSVAMGIAICSFLFGTALYRNQKPGGSPFTRICQVIVAAVRKWSVNVPEDGTLLYEVEEKESAIEGSRKIEHTDEITFLDKAATKMVGNEDNMGNTSPWLLCTVTQVEEVKIMIRILPIWASTIIYFTVYTQMSTFFVEQGLRMDSRVGANFKIPAASLASFDTLSIIVCVPLYDRYLVPFIRRITKVDQGFTILQRIGIGLFLSIITMVVAAIIETKRLQLAVQYDLVDNDSDPVPMSIWWQIPQYFLVGASEVFTSIGQLEFFYDQSPDAMRSLGSALALSTVAIGNFLSSLLVSVVTKATTGAGNPGWIPDNLNHGHLDYYFYLISLISAFNLLFFWYCTKHYKYKKVRADPL